MDKYIVYFDYLTRKDDIYINAITEGEAKEKARKIIENRLDEDAFCGNLTAYYRINKARRLTADELLAKRRAVKEQIARLQEKLKTMY